MNKEMALACLAVAAMALPASADEAHAMVNPADIKWGDAPPVLPKGAKAAVLYGDPSKPGPFVMRLQAPAHYKIAPHWHTNAEVVTVISGSVAMGMGDAIDPKAHVVKAGGFAAVPGKAHHYAVTQGATILQINGEGPFDMTYVNPADDPSKKK